MPTINKSSVVFAVKEFLKRRWLRWVAEMIFYTAILVVAFHALGLVSFRTYIIAFVTGAVFAEVGKNGKQQQTQEGVVIASYASGPYPGAWAANVSLILSAAAWFGSFSQAGFSVDGFRAACFLAGGLIGLAYLLRFAAVVLGPDRPGRKKPDADEARLVLKSKAWVIARAAAGLIAAIIGIAIFAAVKS